MAKVTLPQEIPAEWLEQYRTTLRIVTSRGYVIKRTAFRIPHMQSVKGHPSMRQWAHREVFKYCVECFNRQPKTGGVEPPEIGPRNRSWWYDAAAESGIWYYDYFMQQTIWSVIDNIEPDWCKSWLPVIGDTYISEQYPDEKFNEDWTMSIGFDNGYEYQAWIHKWENGKTKLYIYNVTNWNTGEVPYSIWFDFYKCENTWSIANITWNTKPEIGALFHSIQLTQDNVGWIEIPVPETYSVVIKARTNIGAGIRIVSSRHDNPDWLPYWD
jgi:hypothetical protein